MLWQAAAGNNAIQVTSMAMHYIRRMVMNKKIDVAEELYLDY